MQKKLTYLLFFIALFFAFNQAEASCNWKNRMPYFYSWDSCNTSTKKASVNAYIAFQYNTSCFKYTWKVNGNVVSGSNVMQKVLTQNGTYIITLSVRDTCNNCDTTFTGTKTISCFPKCNWKAKNATFYIVDSCSSTPSKPSFLNYLYFQNNTSKCLKYTWKVNGTTIYSGANPYKSYFPTQNGTYNVTVNVRDTCANCDTTYSNSVTISCAGNKCTWYKRNMYFNAWDSCNGRKYKNSINGYIGPFAGCYKYSWTVNGAKVSDSRFLNYPITQNGTYNLCMKVTDTCDKCDTTFCRSFTITCVSSNGCYMPKQRPGYKLNCDTIIFESGNIDTCVTYLTRRYTPSTGKVDTISNKRIFSYIFKDTGLYYFMTSYHNKCKNCDTSIYTRLHVTCKTNTSNCRWANSSRQIYFNTWDSCAGKGKNKVSINGYIGPFNGCYKYRWKVNGSIVSDSRFLNYGITKNGTYNLCMTILDTCSKCDTTYCKSFNVTCIPTCNWKSRITANNYFDSCNGVGYANSLNAYVAMNQNYKTACYKYRWTVNGAYVGNKSYFHTPIYLNGAYNVCVKITDTCAKCDTTICSRRVVNCNNLGLKNNSLNAVKIYPNPASNNINIESTQSSEYTEILSIDGKAIWTGKLEEGINNIVTDQWARGIYIVRIKTVSGISNYKITLE